MITLPDYIDYIRIVRAARRAIWHIEQAWKLSRTCAEIYPDFFRSSSGKNYNDNAHSVIKPHTQIVDATLRKALKNLTGKAE